MKGLYSHYVENPEIQLDWVDWEGLEENQSGQHIEIQFILSWLNILKDSVIIAVNLVSSIATTLVLDLFEKSYELPISP